MTKNEFDKKFKNLSFEMWDHLYDKNFNRRAFGNISESLINKEVYSVQRMIGITLYVDTMSVLEKPLKRYFNERLNIKQI